MGKWWKKKSGLSDVAPATGVPAPWQGDVLLMCEKCLGKLDGDDRKNLRRWFKDRLAQDGLRKQYRLAETSCLDLCPKGRVTMVIGRDLAGPAPLVFPVAPGDDLEPVYQRLTGRAAKET